MINRQGGYVVPPIYDACRIVHGEAEVGGRTLIQVALADALGYLDAQGKEVWPLRS